MGETGWYQRVTITETEGGVERKTNLTLLSFVWVASRGETAKWPNAAEGETVAVFLCLFGMSDPPGVEHRLGPRCQVLQRGLGVGHTWGQRRLSPSSPCPSWVALQA